MRLALLLVVLAWAAPALAQESGGSFGGESWDDEPSGSDWGSGSDYGGSSGSDYGGSSGSDYGGSSYGSSYEADRAAEEAAEEARRAEEERRAEEARRAEEERRREAERVRVLSLPPLERVRALPFPPPPVAALLSAPIRGPRAALASRPTFPTTFRPHAPITATATFRGSVEPATAVCLFSGLGVIFLPIALLLHLVTRPRVPRAAAGTGLARRVTLAFHWTARPQIQGALAVMARRLDLRSKPGLHAACREAVTLLGKHRAAIRYATWQLSTGDARSWFMRMQSDLRARYQSEWIRNEEARAGASHVAREHEGQGLVVVTILVAARTPMRVPGEVSVAEIDQVLAALPPASAGEAQALEVIWSPSEDADRMSSLELEHFYPELVRLGEGVGRMSCTYCRAPFPRELERCPACGAPATRS